MVLILAFFVVIFICFVFDGQDPKSRKTCVMLCGLVLVLVAGLRSSDVGVDTPRYVAYYLENGKMSFAELWAGAKDPGFYVFGRVLYMVFGENYTLYLLTIAFLFQYPVSKLMYDHSPNLMLSHLIYMSMGFFYFSITGLRQTLGLAAVVWAFSFLLSGSKIKAVIAVLVGAIFHKSAIIFLIGIFMAGRKVTAKSVLFYAAITIFMIFQGKGLVADFLAFGAENFDDTRFTDYSMEGATLRYTGFIQLILYFVLAFFLPSAKIRENKNYMVFLNLMIIAILFQSLAAYIAEFFRAAMYFSITMVAFIPLACQYIKNNKRAIEIGLGCFLVFYYILIYHGYYYAFFWS